MSAQSAVLTPSPDYLENDTPFEEMLALFMLEGFEPDEEWLAAMRHIIHSGMTEEEGRRYLMKKYA